MKKLSFDEMASHLPVIDDKILPSLKGGTTYTFDEWLRLEASGIWQGGTVDGYGYVIQDVVVTPGSYGNPNANPNLLLTPYGELIVPVGAAYNVINYTPDETANPVNIGPWDGYTPPVDHPIEYPDPDHDPTEESGVEWDPLDPNLSTMDVY